MKKVLFDISSLGVGFQYKERCTGVYRVTEETLKALIKPDIDLYLISSIGNNESCKEYLQSNYEWLLSKFVYNNKRNLLKRIVNLFIKRYDCYISPYFIIPVDFRRNIFIKKVIIIYDLIQVKFKDMVPDNCFEDYTNFLKKITSDTILLCISECTKNDLLNWKTRAKNENIRTIPLGADDKFKPCSDITGLEKIKQKYAISGKYFFSISSINPRKNFRHIVICFIKFLEKYKYANISLVLAGPPGWGNVFEGVNLNEYKNRIILTGFADENDLPLLYSGAEASVYLSLYEGFGLPPLESLYCSTPVIASNTSSIPEVVGNAGILIDPKDESALINAYNEMYLNDNLKNILKENAKEQIKKYTWEKFAEALSKEIK